MTLKKDSRKLSYCLFSETAANAVAHYSEAHAHDFLGIKI